MKALALDISLNTGPIRGNKRGASFTRVFKRRVKEDSGNGTSLSMGALRGEPGGRAPLLGTLQDI
jgi:hypothetical protein